jgi:hypothetical protein
MCQNNQFTKRKRQVALLTAAVMFSIAGDILAFAGEPMAAVTPSSVKILTETEQQSALANPAADVPEGKHLLSREEMLNGMIEAEKRRSAAARPDAAINNKEMLEKWGVQVISVSYAADGFWLNFRFRVADPDKAGVLFDSKIKPYLESEATGVKMAVPNAAKIGALRTTNRGHNIQANKIYNIMFANPAFHVKPGQKVSVVVGDFKAEHMTVRGVRDNLSISKARAHEEIPKQ